MRTLAAASLLAVLAIATACRPGGDAGAGVLIFAAASLRTALDEITPRCAQAAGVGIRTSFAGTGALARQIEAGAPADVFISADTEWMDHVAARSLIRPDTRVDLLGNALVLVAPTGRAPVPPLLVSPGFPIAAALGTDGRLAVADPASVPAGRYAQAALESLGVWSSVADRLAPAEDVRAALRLVSRAEVPLGIVYRTDAAADSGVVVVDTFPATAHPAIVYPAALTRTASVAAAGVLDCLRAAESTAVFARWGFTTPASTAR